jgi:hypothetical protein
VRLIERGTHSGTVSILRVVAADADRVALGG